VVQLAASGNAFVDTAEAVQAVFVVSAGDTLVNLIKVTDPAGFVIVHGDGDATVRAAEAPDGILVDAGNKATFGADDEASITAANYLVTDPAAAAARTDCRSFPRTATRWSISTRPATASAWSAPRRPAMRSSSRRPAT
jgi:hypothetical protein